MATTPDDHTDQVGQMPATIEKPKALLEIAESRDVMAIVPRNIEEAARYTDGLIKAGQVPDAFREGGKKDGKVNGPLVMMGILKALEVGLPPQTGLASLLPLNGRFTVWGDGAQALVLKSGRQVNQRRSNIGPSFDPATPMGDWPEEFGIEFRAWRKGEEDPYIGQFTVRDAKRAGLWMCSYRKPWIMYPLRMLFNRARAFVYRDGFSDALCGLQIAEEVMDTMSQNELESPNLHRVTDNSALEDDLESGVEAPPTETTSELPLQP